MTDYTSTTSYPAAAIAGNVNRGGIELPCILQEGNITVAANTFGPDGYKDTGVTLASGLVKDEWVVLSTDTANTYIATYGLPVVTKIATGSLILGKIISEPKWAAALPTSSQNTWSTMLAGKYFRVATVWFPGVTGAEKVLLNGADTAAIVPGVAGTILVDDSATDTLSAAGGVVMLAAADAANGGAGIISFHYVAKGAHTQYVLVGFTGGVVAIQA